MTNVFGTLKARELDVSKKPLTAVSSGTTDVIKSQLITNVKCGASTAAVNASINFQTSGSVHGEGTAIYGELVPPNGSLERGALYCLGLGIGAQASSTWGSAGPVAFIKFDSWGTATEVDDEAFFFDVQGLNEATTHMFSAGAGALTTAGTLKIRVGGTTYYLMLASNEAN